MSSRRSSLLAVAALVPITAAAAYWANRGSHTPYAGAPVDARVDSRLVTAVNSFGFRLYHDLVARNPSGNVFISPASIELALAMTYNGAGGTTKQQVAKTLGISGMTMADLNRGNAGLFGVLHGADPKVEIDIANSLWGNLSFQFDDAFKQRTTSSYGAEIRSIDFSRKESAAEINSWVSDKTNQKIPDLVTWNQVRLAAAVLVNALYFKGEWSRKFDKALTHDGPFTLLDGSPVTLPMMQQTGEFAYAETDGAQLVCLPYGAKRLAAYVLLPREGVSFPGFVQSLTAPDMDALIGKAIKQRGSIALPRFKAQYGASLRQPLEALGMPIAFTPAADFRGMEKGRPGGLWISEVIHKTTLEVNEEGTEAAAATAVIMTKSVRRDSFSMLVNRPFVFILRDTQTGVILFMGSIVNPQSQSGRNAVQ